VKYIVKTAIFISIVLGFIYSAEVNVVELVLFLALLTAAVFTDTNSKIIKMIALSVECIILYFIGVHTEFLYMGILVLVFDSIYTKHYYFGAAAVFHIIYFQLYLREYQYWLIILFAGTIAYALKNETDKQEKYHGILDNERRTKYELELAQAKLIKSNKEVEKLAEAKERNRIARDVHDNVGHSIAGILIKLQATKKVLDKDTDKGNEMIDECVVHLKDSLEVLRDTVHNIYRHEKHGTDYIKSIVDEYKYCESQIKISGQYKNCTERTFSALSFVLKEALTNTAKHSKATKINVELKGEDFMVYMMIIDNGKGCSEIKESLGIRSMRDRVRGLNGKLKIDGSDGMKITCDIPL